MPRSVALAAAGIATAAAFAAAAGAPGYTPNERELRMLMTDFKFISLVVPCVAPNARRFIAAEWIRTAFHDAATYDAATGTGGIDGSLWYETDRSENAGFAIPSTLDQFDSFDQDGVSFADLTVLGGILATTSAHVHAGIFKRMGFNATEMIELVACGHTMGSVHAQFTPEVTDLVAAPFDSTRLIFDNTVAVEWIKGISNNTLAKPPGAGGPETRSDANIFEIDGNKTMSDLASSKQAFDNACARVFTRLFDEAIPRGTVLSNPIEPFPVSIGFDNRLINENFWLRAPTIRLWNMAGKYKSVSLNYLTRNGAVGTQPFFSLSATPRVFMNGRLHLFDFSTEIPIDPVEGISAMKVTVVMNDGTVYDDKDGGSLYPIDDSIRIDTGSSFTCQIKNAAAGTAGLNITALVYGGPGQDVQFILKHTDRSVAPRVRGYYRRQRDGTPYSYYNVFIPDIAAFNNGQGVREFGVALVRPNGEVVDLSQGVWYKVVNIINCKATGIVPTEPVVFITPTPSPTVSPTPASTMPATSDVPTPSSSSDIPTPSSSDVPTPSSTDLPTPSSTNLPASSPADTPSPSSSEPTTPSATESPCTTTAIDTPSPTPATTPTTTSTKRGYGSNPNTSSPLGSSSQFPTPAPTPVPTPAPEPSQPAPAPQPYPTTTPIVPIETPHPAISSTACEGTPANTLASTPVVTEEPNPDIISSFATGLLPGLVGYAMSLVVGWAALF
ncbi:hypothetical protein HK105_203041 [Polyrhizophydium stewartii]|uniref:Peroxidase n=1 Tax=Polyrhizophydium stewartii TaxID=2732419 RepID=A0ABR4NCX2_9FUNG